MSIEKHTKKMYNLYGNEYQKSREEKRPERAYNEYLEIPSMIKAVGDIEGKKLLDIGCGAGIHVKKYLKKGAIVSGIDISKTMISLARKKCPSIDFKIGTITNLPYKSSSFDIVTASLVMDYVTDLKKAFSEVNRVLKKKGLFYHSDMSQVASAREFKEDSRLRCNAVGYFKDKKHGKLIVLGKHWEGGVKDFEMVPGMVVKCYKRGFRTYLKALVASGFELIDLIDCKPVLAFKKYNPKEYKIFTKFPMFSIWVSRKKIVYFT